MFLSNYLIMNFIDEFYENLNIYYSLIIYDHDPPYDLVRQMRLNDYPVIILYNVNEIEHYEINNRVFVIDKNLLKELLFVKNNNIHEYTVMFCMNDTFETVCEILDDSKPNSIESVYITSI